MDGYTYRETKRTSCKSKMKQRVFNMGMAIVIGAITFFMLVGLSNVKPIAAENGQPEISAHEYVDRWDEI